MAFQKGDPRLPEWCRMKFHARVRNKWKRIGRKRWDTMTKEEKELFEAKREYSRKMRQKQAAKLNRQLEHTNFKVSSTDRQEDLDGVENFFFGDVW